MRHAQRQTECRVLLAGQRGHSRGIGCFVSGIIMVRIPPCSRLCFGQCVMLFDTTLETNLWGDFSGEIARAAGLIFDGCWVPDKTVKGRLKYDKNGNLQINISGR